MRHLSLVIFALLVWSCRNETTEPSTLVKDLTAQEIVDRSIAVSGGDEFNNSSIGFYFRDIYYAASRKRGDFSLSRIKVEEGDSIIDILSNEGFARFVNNEFQKLPDSLGQKYSASVNSVHYFSILPYGLNDAAVHKQLLGTEAINGQEHYKIQVSFNAVGGGEDYEDVFIYWISQDSFKANYIAYSYEEEDGVGLRFREAYNERYINGLRFVDYRNFKPNSDKLKLVRLGEAFNSKQLAPVSTIELREIQVRLFNLK